MDSTSAGLDAALSVRPPWADRHALVDTVAIVTGASSGLGRRFAQVLHGCGAHVVIAARRAELLDELAAGLGERVTAVSCDVTAEADLQDLVDRALSISGRIDVLVNNAGISLSGAAEDERPEDRRRVMDVNFHSTADLAALVGRHMLEAGTGSIINVASILALVAGAPIKNSAYCASKGAVAQLTRQLGCEWARRGVRVNAIAPGWFESEMTADEMFGDEKSLAFIRRETPMGRAGAFDELDGVLLFLATDASRFVTGQIIAVDGGWSAR